MLLFVCVCLRQRIFQLDWIQSWSRLSVKDGYQTSLPFCYHWCARHEACSTVEPGGTGARPDTVSMRLAGREASHQERRTDTGHNRLISLVCWSAELAAGRAIVAQITSGPRLFPLFAVFLSSLGGRGIGCVWHNLSDAGGRPRNVELSTQLMHRLIHRLPPSSSFIG